MIIVQTGKYQLIGMDQSKTIFNSLADGKQIHIRINWQKAIPSNSSRNLLHLTKLARITSDLGKIGQAQEILAKFILVLVRHNSLIPTKY